MKRTISIFMIIALICSMVIPSFAVDGYYVDFRLSSESLTRDEKLLVDGTVFNSGSIQTYRSYTVDINDSKGLKEKLQFITDKNGQFDFSVTLSEFNLGKASIVIKSGAEIVGQKSFDVVSQKDTTSGNITFNLDKNSYYPGDVISGFGKILKGDGLPLKNSILNVEFMKSGNIIEVQNVNTDSEGNFILSNKLSDTYVEGEYSIKVNYENISAKRTFKIVNKPTVVSLTGIEFDKNSKSTFKIGESASYSIVAKYSDNSSKTLSITDVTLSATPSSLVKIDGLEVVALSEGSVSLVAKYQGLETQLKINIEKNTTIINSMKLDFDQYAIGSKVKGSGYMYKSDGSPISNGILCGGIYESGEKIEVFNCTTDSTGKFDFEFMLNSGYKAGNYSVKVNYLDNYTSANFKVYESNGMISLMEFDKSSYKVGEIVKVSGVLYDNNGTACSNMLIPTHIQKSGSTIEVLNTRTDSEGRFKFDYKLSSNLSEGSYSIKISNGTINITKTFNIVKADEVVTLNSIEFEKEAKNVIKIGDDYTYTILGNYSNGTVIALDEKDVKITATPNDLVSINGLTVKAIKKGTVELTAEYQGKKSTVRIQIPAAEPKITSIEISNISPVNIKVGDKVKIDVNAKYSDGSTQLLIPSKILFLATEKSTKGVSKGLDYNDEGYLVGNSEGAYIAMFKYKGMLAVLEINITAKSTGGSTGGTSGGSSGGGYVPGNSNTPVAIPKSAEKAVSSITGIKGKSTSNKAEKDKAVAGAVAAINQVKTIKSIDEKSKVASVISENITDAIKDLNYEDSRKIVDSTNDLMMNIISSKEISSLDAANLIKGHIEKNINQLISKTTIASEKIKIEKQVTRMLETSISKGTNILLIGDENIALGLEGKEKTINQIIVDKSSLSKAITKSIESRSLLKASLAKSGFSKLVDKIDILVQVNIESQGDEQIVNLPVESVKELAKSKVGAAIVSDGVTFNVPYSLISESQNDIKIQINPDYSISSNPSSLDKGGIVTPVMTYDFDFIIGDKSYKNNDGDLNVSIDISDLVSNGQSADTLVVKVLNNGKWESVNYKIDNDIINFNPKHFSVYSIMSYKTEFTDINNHWGSKFITKLSANGIVNGKSKSTFDPEGKITRAELSKVLVEIAGLKGTKDSLFTDVESSAWYNNYVNTAKEFGITFGEKDDLFRPNEYVTREEMAVMISKTFEIMNNMSIETVKGEFTDAGSIDNNAKNYVYFAKESGLINGYPDGSFMPKGNLTRAEASSVLYKLLDN